MNETSIDKIFLSVLIVGNTAIIIWTIIHLIVIRKRTDISFWKRIWVWYDFPNDNEIAPRIWLAFALNVTGFLYYSIGLVYDFL